MRRDRLGRDVDGQTPRKRLLLRAAGAGAFVGACWLPWGLAPLLPLAFFSALRGLRRVETPRDAVVFGLAYGATRYAVASHFLLALLRYSPLAFVFYLLAIAYILPYGLVESWGAFTLEKRLHLPRSMGFALLFAAGEWARTLGDLSFPADPLAHAFGTAPAWLSLVGFTGPFGITLLAFAAAILFDLAVEWRPRPRLATTWGLSAVAVWLLPPAVDRVAAPPAETGPAFRVAVVQPFVEVRDKLDRARWPDLWKRLETMTLEAARGADVVVWPETARPGPVIWKEPAPFSDPEMRDLAARAGVPILYGCEIARLRDGQVRALYNGAALARPDGGAAWYGKQHLLPFVEGLPFAAWFGYDPAEHARAHRGERSLLSMLGNFVAGPEPAIFEVGPARIGVMICYEGLYASLARRLRAAGANTLVVLTNDSWWGHSVFPSWHAQMVSTRARELDVPIVRAANNGVSSVTDRFGRIHDATRLDEITILRATISPGSRAATFYAHHGDRATFGVAVLLVAGIAVTTSRRRQRFIDP